MASAEPIGSAEVISFPSAPERNWRAVLAQIRASIIADGGSQEKADFVAARLERYWQAFAEPYDFGALSPEALAQVLAVFQAHTAKLFVMLVQAYGETFDAAASGYDGQPGAA